MSERDLQGFLRSRQVCTSGGADKSDFMLNNELFIHLFASSAVVYQGCATIAQV